MSTRERTIRQVRAYTLRGGGADYHDQQAGHWIDDHIATPMSAYPPYRESRQSFGLNLLGTLVVEVEADNVIQPDVGWWGHHRVDQDLRIGRRALTHRPRQRRGRCTAAYQRANSANP
ncbi:hypothetical protein [Microlunatus elymi]|uniref:hypothetical protein n=1 Tax=Microlunatus elymi TaxID=2596828 RepID=UPI001AEF79CE|nr:hypothetical protein [Microlunatus elymi]